MTHARLMNQTLIFCVTVFLLSMGSIVYLAQNRVITIEDVAQDEVMLGERKGNIAGDDSAYALRFESPSAEDELEEDTFRIPLPENSKASDIQVENHYMEREVKISIPDTPDDFYKAHALTGESDALSLGTYESSDSGVTLNFRLTGIYECRTILENGELTISFLTPSELYDRVIVIDPMGGETEFGETGSGLVEKNIALQVARSLKEKLDKTDIKVYYTRMDDSFADAESRVALGNDAGADFYIRIEAATSEDSSVYGIDAVYNAEYFIPEFGNIELADYLEQEVTEAVSNRANGLFAADETDEVLEGLTIPAATIRVGYLSNEKEAQLLLREDYIDKLAEGIDQAIERIYEEALAGTD